MWFTARSIWNIFKCIAKAAGHWSTSKTPEISVRDETVITGDKHQHLLNWIITFQSMMVVKLQAFTRWMSNPQKCVSLPLFPLPFFTRERVTLVSHTLSWEKKGLGHVAIIFVDAFFKKHQLSNLMPVSHYLTDNWRPQWKKGRCFW